MLFPWSPYFSYSLAPELRKKLKSSKNNFWQSLSHWQLYKDKLPKKLNAEIFGALEIPILTDTRKSIMAKIWIFPKLGTKFMLTLNWTVAAPSFSAFCWCHSLLSPCRTFMIEYVDFYSFSNLLLCTSKWWEEIMKKEREGEMGRRNQIKETVINKHHMVIQFRKSFLWLSFP